MTSVLTLATEHSTTMPVLTTMIVVPVLGALVVALLPRRRTELIRLAAVTFSFAAGALTLFALATYDDVTAGDPARVVVEVPDDAAPEEIEEIEQTNAAALEEAHDAFQFRSEHSWIEDFGISWHLGLDGISLFLVVLTGVLFPIAMLATMPRESPKAYFAWLLVLEAGCLGVFVALDLFLFFVFFEIVLVPMYFLIGGWGYSNRVYAAMKFFLYTMFGSAFMLVAILAVAFLHRSATGTGQLTFDVVDIATTQAIATNSARWLFLAFAIAFAVKVPVWPLHTWLPDAHTEAPTAGSVILAGVLLKLGTYGFLRFGVYLFPEAAVWAAPGLVTLGVVGIIYGAIVAGMQKDLKRLVAYSSVAHLGFIVLGTFALTTQGVQGSVLQMVNHGISTGALFLLVGMIYERRHTRSIAELRGLQKSAPVLAGVFMVVMLSSIGLPGLNGFVGEFLILIGSFLTRRWWTVVAAAGVILAAFYLLWAYQRVFHGEPEGDNATMPDLGWRDGLVMAPLVGLIVFLGVYPKPVLDRIEPAVDRMVAHVELHVEDFRQPDAAKSHAQLLEEGEGQVVDVTEEDE